MDGAETVPTELTHRHIYMYAYANESNFAYEILETFLHFHDYYHCNNDNMNQACMCVYVNPQSTSDSRYPKDQGLYMCVCVVAHK